MASDDTDDSTDESSGDWEPEEPTRVDDETIVVPMRMYKGITVFSTLLAVVLVVFGFFMFDAATQDQNLIRQAVVGLLSLVGLEEPVGVLDVGFGLLGITMILVGAGSYILGTRFKTADMLGGDSAEETDDDADEESADAAATAAAEASPDDEKA
jgi:hypothetical protein